LGEEIMPNQSCAPDTVATKVVYQGKIFEVEQRTVRYGDQERVFEIARRSPGVRMIMHDKNKGILLTQEYRHEHGNWDWRLPGGKVFDHLQEYLPCVTKPEILLSKAHAAALREAAEETGYDIGHLTHLCTDSCGATIAWDLYYFIATDCTLRPEGPSPEMGENIRSTWVSTADAFELAINGSIQETRSAAVLLRYLHQIKSC
jgi:ADP-ribose pyrophosphatase